MDKWGPGEFNYRLALLSILTGLCCLALMFFDGYKRKQFIRIDILPSAALSAVLAEKTLPYLIQNTLSLNEILIAVFVTGTIIIYFLKIGWNGTYPLSKYDFRDKL